MLEAQGKPLIMAGTMANITLPVQEQITLKSGTADLQKETKMSIELEQKIASLKIQIKHLENLRGLQPPPGYQVAPVKDAYGDADDQEACRKCLYVVIPQGFAFTGEVQFLGFDFIICGERIDLQRDYLNGWGETPEEAIASFWER